MIFNSLITCPYCHVNLTLEKQPIPLDYGLAHCKCSKYPVIEGIVYMKSQNIKTVVDGVKTKKFRNTYTHLLEFSFSSKLFFYFTYSFRFLFKFIGFKNFIRLLTFFSFPKDWATYPHPS